MLCKILLHNAAEHVFELQEHNLLREQEAEEYFHEIEHAEHGLNHESFGSDVARGNSVVKKVFKSVNKSLKGLDSSNHSLVSLSSRSKKSGRSSTNKLDHSTKSNGSANMDMDQSISTNEEQASKKKSGSSRKSKPAENISIPQGDEVEAAPGFLPQVQDDDDEDGEILF